MENASKALLIAGAILLVILIISLGLVIYNQAKDSVGSANLDQQEIEAFNSKFTSYEGNSVSGSQVNRLIQTVISSNQSEVSGSTGKYVAICFESLAKHPSSTLDTSIVYMAVSKNEGKVKYATDGYDDNLKDGYAQVMESAKSGVTEEINGSAVPTWSDSSDVALKVNEGVNYTVRFLYTNGLIDRIIVQKN